MAQEVLDRLESAGLIDDAAYAATLARTRFAEKGLRGARSLRSCVARAWGSGRLPRPCLRSSLAMSVRLP